jgi:hypothetical protein
VADLTQTATAAVAADLTHLGDDKLQHLVVARAIPGADPAAAAATVAAAAAQPESPAAFNARRTASALPGTAGEINLVGRRGSTLTTSVVACMMSLL